MKRIVFGVMVSAAVAAACTPGGQGTAGTVYVTNERFESVPLKKLSGSAQFSAEERFQDSVSEAKARTSADGRYLVAAMPPLIMPPVYVR